MKLPSVAELIGRLPPAARPVVRTALYGLAAGFAAIVFRLGIHEVYDNGIRRLSELSLGRFLIGSLLLVMATAGFSAWLLNRFCPEAVGGGIPRLKLSFWKDFGQARKRLAPLKLLGGVLAVGGGSSLGPEGPTLQIGGAVASNLAGVCGEPAQKRRAAAAAGAAAALAAAFNTPLAAVTFVLEEVVADLNSKLIGGMLLASVLGSFVAHALVGEQPAFQLGTLGRVGWPAYAMVPLVAAFVALVGNLFQRGALAVRGWNKQARPTPLWLRAALGGACVWALGIGVYLATGRLGVFSYGYDDLTAALNGTVPLHDSFVLLGAKLLATAVCFGLGGAGGLFAPTLFFGAMAGAVVAGLAGILLPLTPSECALLAVVGMSSALAATGGAPVTSIFIVFEMTHEFAVVPPLIVAALVARPLARALARHNIYDAILKQDGQDIEQVIPPRDLRAWQDAPISRIANFRPVLVRDTSPAALAQLLKEKTHDRFPVVHVDARPRGLLTRAELKAALKEGREPVLVDCPAVRRETSLREVQRILIDAPDGMVLIQAGADDRIIGLVTLHDLLRAEAAFGAG